MAEFDGGCCDSGNTAMGYCDSAYPGDCGNYESSDICTTAAFDARCPLEMMSNGDTSIYVGVLMGSGAYFNGRRRHQQSSSCWSSCCIIEIVLPMAFMLLVVSLILFKITFAHEKRSMQE